MSVIHHDFQEDIDDIGQIPVMNTLLNAICQTTGMGFAAVARVTEERWITCSVHDAISFGLKPGDELELQTTICNEIRLANKAVVIDSVKDDPEFRDHHTPAMYGFQSYISVPIIRKDGSFFGTLCAIDPHPHEVSSPAVMGMFILYADLIAFHLHAIESVRHSEAKLLKDKEFIGALEKNVSERTQELNEKNAALEKMNKELQAFAYISSHDLQEPLRKIQTIASVIIEKESANLSLKGQDYFKRMQDAAQRMQTLINDLLAYSRTNMTGGRFEDTDLNEILGEVTADLTDEMQEKKITITAPVMCHAFIIPFQFRQLMYNLVSNAIKFSRPDVPLTVTIRSEVNFGRAFSHDQLLAGEKYCHISIADNGIGFDQKFSERIFELFQRLEDRSHYKGTGIGLSIVKKIVENHNGFITAKGKVNEGAAFDIYLPVAQ